MLRSNKRKTKSLINKTAELAIAIPQVIAHRVARMAIASASVSKRDRKEFQLMSNEKKDAFLESWNAMIMQAIHANQAMAASFLRSFWLPKGRPSVNAVAAELQRVALGVLNKGMAPVHRKATANARRLARTRLR